MTPATSQPGNGQPAVPLTVLNPRAAPLTAPRECQSPSQVNCYLGCPCKWYYRYLVGLDDPKNSSLALGIAVDEALSHNFRQKAETRQDLPAGAVCDAFSCAWAEQAAEATFVEGEDPDDFHEAGRGLVDLFMAKRAPHIQPAVIDGAPAVQVKVSGEIAGVPVRGVIDLFTEDGVTVDLKTSARKPGSIGADYRLQMTTYDLLNNHSRGLARFEYMIRTKTPKVEPYAIEITPADVAYAEAVYPLALEGMKDGLHIPRRSSNLCSRKYCSFWQRCEADFGGKVDG